MNMLVKENEMAKTVVDACIKIHKALGPGLLESAYQEAMAVFFTKRNILLKKEFEWPVFFEGEKLNTRYRLDFLVGDCLIVELKSVEKILPVHEAQTITYLKLSPYKLALLVNFNMPLVKDGIRRFVDEREKSFA